MTRRDTAPPLDAMVLIDCVPNANAYRPGRYAGTMSGRTVTFVAGGGAHEFSLEVGVPEPVAVLVFVSEDGRTVGVHRARDVGGDATWR